MTHEGGIAPYIFMGLRLSELVRQLLLSILFNIMYHAIPNIPVRVRTRGRTLRLFPFLGHFVSSAGCCCLPQGCDTTGR